MSATVTSIAPPKGTHDPLRDALRMAIEAERAAEQAVAERRTAIAKANGLVEVAERELEGARQGVRAARASRASALADGLARGGAASSGGASTKAARVVESDAEDGLDAAREALAQLEADLPDLQEDVVRAESDVVAAVNALLVPAAEAALAEAKVAKARFLRAQAALQTILAAEDDRDARRFANPMERHRRREARVAPLEAMKAEARSILIQTMNIDEADFGTSKAVQEAWRGARARLLEDPEAALPTLAEADAP